MSNKKNAPRLGDAMSGVGSLMASLTCIVAGLIIGFIALLVLGWAGSPWHRTAAP